ncbi:MAG: thermonuclease family protein, partial [Candidatus Spechtbacterales bacterium]
MGAGFLIWAQVGTDRADYPDAREYAPNLWFDSEEKYYPADPLDFYYDKNGEELSGKTAVAEYDKLSLDEKFGKVKVFYNINDAGDEIVYQYWLFYVMNNYENGHYGDWESVFVFIDKESKNINKAVGSAHGSGHVLEIKSQDARHIWTYVGNGSHANCPDEKVDGTCDFFAWNLGRQGGEWTQEDIDHGKKISHTDYVLYDLDFSYINKFAPGKSFDKQKSPTLGLNPYKVVKLDKVRIPFLETKEEKYINLPLIGDYFGKTPTFAWAKEEYHNPQKVLVPVHAKIASNIAGFFKNTGNFIAGIGIRNVSDNLSEAGPDVLGQTPIAPRPAEPTPAPIIARGQPSRGGLPQTLIPTPVSAVAEPETEVALVTRVIDGDTVELSSGQKLRYIGIDAPELPDNCFAQDATEKNRALVENKQIVLLKGPTDTDIYGRLLRFVWQDVNLSGTIDSPDIFVTVSLVEGGYAYASNFGENHAYSHRFETVESAAKLERRGFWGDACLEKKILEELPDTPVRPIVRIYEPPTSPARSTDPIDLTAPTSTIAVANYAIDNPTFQIQWNTTADDLAYYQVQYKIGSSSAWQDWGSATTTTTSKNYQNATNGTYYFRVRGTDIHQNIGAWAESAGVVIDLYQIVINEIQISDSEFVELYNPSSSTTTLAGYYFSYYPSTRISWNGTSAPNGPFRNKLFPAGAAIPPAGYYLVGLKDYATTTGNPKADWQPYDSMQLSNSAGTVAIFPFDPTSASSSQYAYDNRVDTIGWGTGIALYEGASAATTPAAGQSLTRNASHTDTDNNFADFTVATSTTPKNSNGETYVLPPPPSNPIWAMYQKDAR